MRRLVVFLAGVFVLTASSNPRLVVLADDDHALVEHFNARADELRFIAILSPT
jgi:hypothetical protein